MSVATYHIITYNVNHNVADATDCLTAFIVRNDDISCSNVDFTGWSFTRKITGI